MRNRERSDPSLRQAKTDAALQPPEPWPYGSLAAWQAWRAALDTSGDPYVAQLRVEADRELARIERCEPHGPAVPSRHPVVPGWKERGNL
jgi:hypothetical protein